MIIYTVAVAVQIAARTASTDTNAPFTESLGTLAANHELYLASVSAGLASSVLLIGLAAGLYSIFRSRQPFLALAATFLFLAAALSWLISAASDLTLASLAQEFVSASGIPAETIASSARAVDLVREFTAGLALLWRVWGR